MAKMTREEILSAAAQIHLDEGWEIREELDAIRKRANANRQALTNEANLGHLDEVQHAEYLELYPVRERATASERVERLEAQLEKAREKADKEVVAPETDDVDDAVAAAA